MKIIDSRDCKVSKWAGGETKEYFIYPENSNVVDRNFDIRISSATVELDKSTFTPFDGYDRFLMILEGQLAIHHQGQYSKELNAFDYDLFSGDWTTTSEGKVIDFNVIYKKGFKFEFKIIDMNEQNKEGLIDDFEFMFILQGLIVLNQQNLDSGTLIQDYKGKITILNPAKLLVFKITK